MIRLDLIDLDQDLPGQRQFISCWLARSEGLSYVVDPGPPGTALRLVARLRELGVTDLDFVLLTHVHLDHGGAAAAVLDAFPGSRAACLDAAARHLVDPTRLWEGSRRVLGPVAEAYGEPAPVPAERIAALDEVAARGVDWLPTPGHAPHHVCFVHGDVLFAGEAAGTTAPLPGGRLYLRPATPPRFFPAEAGASLDRLLALSPPPRRVAMAHYGLVEGKTRALLTAARDQLELWVAAVRREAAAGREGLVGRVHGRLLAEDPHYAAFTDLPADIRERELVFTAQSVLGMLGHIEAST